MDKESSRRPVATVATVRRNAKHARKRLTCTNHAAVRVPGAIWERNLTGDSLVDIRNRWGFMSTNHFAGGSLLNGHIALDMGARCPASVDQAFSPKLKSAVALHQHANHQKVRLKITFFSKTQSKPRPAPTRKMYPIVEPEKDGSRQKISCSLQPWRVLWWERPKECHVRRVMLNCPKSPQITRFPLNKSRGLCGGKPPSSKC